MDDKDQGSNNVIPFQVLHNDGRADSPDTKLMIPAVFNNISRNEGEIIIDLELPVIMSQSSGDRMSFTLMSVLDWMNRGNASLDGEPAMLKVSAKIVGVESGWPDP